MDESDRGLGVPANRAVRVSGKKSARAPLGPPPSSWQASGAVGRVGQNGLPDLNGVPGASARPTDVLESRR